MRRGRLRERYDPALPAFSAIGYREGWAVLDGERTLEEAIDLRRAAQRRSSRRRQRTWFRREPGLAVLDAASDPALGPSARAGGIEACPLTTGILLAP